MANYQTPSERLHYILHEGFKFYNEKLFDSRLPECMIIIHRKRGAAGYFWQEQWTNTEGTEKMHEIAMCPDAFDHGLDSVLSTLVHEMTHLEQQEFGEPGKNGYHNKDWVKLMEAVGLTPTSTGRPGGAQTGRKVTHMIDEGGPFETVTEELLKEGFAIEWAAIRPTKKEAKKDLSKVKHTCPECEAKVWGKLGIYVECGDCNERMLPPEED